MTLRPVPGSFQKGSPVPGQYTNKPETMAPRGVLRAIDAIPGRVRREQAKDGWDGLTSGYDGYSDEELYSELQSFKSQMEPEQARLRSLYRRWDDLYHPTTMSEGGADHWPEGRPKAGGRVHISLNVYRALVNIPASLQAVMPVFNVPPTGAPVEEREQATRIEQLFFRWLDDNDMELRLEDTCRVKGLYGVTAWKVWWDAIAKMPTFRVIEKPENLYLGWGDSDFSQLDRALYCYGISPMTAEMEYGIRDPKRTTAWVPSVRGGDHADPLGQMSPYRGSDGRSPTGYEQEHVEVYDYWWKEAQPRRKNGDPKPPVVYNTIYVGDVQVKSATKHPEYDDLPYVVIHNGRVPGTSEGVSDLYDVEQIVREKDERLSQLVQILHGTVGNGDSGGQMWQLVGPDADSIGSQAKPRPGHLAVPGPGNRIEAITPSIPSFPFEQVLSRFDHEITVITGLSPLLLGDAPLQSLGSSRAISALIAQYEARIHPNRKVLYRGIRHLWAMSAMMWERKDRDVRKIIDGNHRLEIKPPELTPRDELETAQKALNLVNGKVWSLERAMDATGVEDPSDEKALIREEQTDASLFPAAVQAMVQLKAILDQQGQQNPDVQAQQQAQERSLNAARTLTGVPAGSDSLNSPDVAGNAPPEALPANAEGSFRAQTMLQGGEAQSRILSETPVG